MMKNVLGLLLVLILMLLLLYSQGLLPSLNNTGDETVTFKEVTFSDENSPVRMVSANIGVEDETSYLEGKIINNSNVPVTLVEISIACAEVVEVFHIAHEKDAELNRVVPVEIAIGQEYDFKKGIGGFDPSLDSCLVGVKSWGKYGVKE